MIVIVELNWIYGILKKCCTYCTWIGLFIDEGRLTNRLLNTMKHFCNNREQMWQRTFPMNFVTIWRHRQSGQFYYVGYCGSICCQVCIVVHTVFEWNCVCVFNKLKVEALNVCKYIKYGCVRVCKPVRISEVYVSRAIAFKLP